MSVSCVHRLCRLDTVLRGQTLHHTASFRSVAAAPLTRRGPRILRGPATQCAVHQSVGGAQEVAQTARATIVTPPAPCEPPPTKFQEFGRNYWPIFAFFQFLALVGATYNGYLSKKRRLELQEVHTKLRLITENQRAYIEDACTLPEDSVSPEAEVSEKLLSAQNALKAGSYQEAEREFKIAGALAETRSDVLSQQKALVGTATARQQMGKLKAAAEFLEKAISLSEDDSYYLSELYGRMGDIYTDMGKMDEAGRMYDLCLSSSPDDI